MQPVVQSVVVRGLDPLTVAGLASQLRAVPEVSLVTQGAVDVVVVALDRFEPHGAAFLRRTAAELGKPIVLVVDEIAEVELPVAVECRVVAVLARETVTGQRLAQCVTSAAAAGLPSDLLDRLVEQTERLRNEVLAAQGEDLAGLAPREIDVLRLMADGLDTAEIATRLRYSERTVKNIISAITTRLHLRNRPQAVAYAMRAGVI